MSLFEKYLGNFNKKELTNESTKGHKGKKGSFFCMWSSVCCDSSDDYREEFTFNPSTRKKPLYSQEEELDNSISRFCRQCKNRDGEGMPQSVFIDIAREIVNSDDESKAERNYFRFMMFKYPWLSYAGVAGGAFSVGALTYFAFS
jgi:hypothetical protein